MNLTGKKLAGLVMAVVAGCVVQAQSRPAQKETSRPAITGIAFVRVYASDATASEKFYRSLGLKPEELKNGERYAISDVQWVEVEPLPTPAPGSRLEAVGLMTRDVAGMERYLKAKGVAIEEPLRDGEFGVKDPEGNRVVFVQAGTHAGQASGSAASRRIIHAGFMVKDRAAEDRFYHDVLGFKPYWHGGRTEDRTDWVSLQVPEGSDWVEYMLNASADPTPQQLGGMNHFSLGVTHMSDVVDVLAKNHCEGPNCTKTQMGRDGKVQLNVFDPDLTRVEFMEFKPSGVTCCSPILGKMPGETEDR